MNNCYCAFKSRKLKGNLLTKAVKLHVAAGRTAEMQLVKKSETTLKSILKDIYNAVRSFFDKDYSYSVELKIESNLINKISNVIQQEETDPERLYNAILDGYIE